MTPKAGARRQARRQTPRPDPARRSSGPARPGRWRVWAWPAGIALLTVVVFLPTLGNDFVLWDDDANFLHNPAYRGLGWRHLAWMFTTFHLGPYMPFTWLTLGLDYLAWGLRPAGYHLTSLLFHVAAAVMLYFVALQLLRAARTGATEIGTQLGATTAALLFAVHPLRVESVAWISERRDVVSGALALVATFAYLRAVAGPTAHRTRWYWTACGAFVAALLAKATVASLPLVLLVLDVYPLRRLGAGPDRRRTLLQLVVEKWPFVAAALVAGVVAVAGQREAQALSSLDRLGPLERLGISVYAMAFYLAKMLWPAALSPHYAMPERFEAVAWPIAMAATTLGGLTGLALALRQRLPGLAAAWGCYLITVLPISGLLHTGSQIAADRYTYLPSIAWAVALGGGVGVAWERRSRPSAPRLVVATVVFAIVGVLGALTWRQVGYWHDSETLWLRAATASPSALAYAKLAQAQLVRNANNQAVASAREAVHLSSRSAVANAILADALAASGAASEALGPARRAVQLEPKRSFSHLSLGRVLALTGAIDEAIEQFRLVIQLDPDAVAAHNNLAVLLWHAGRLDETEAALRRALALYPEYERAHRNLGRLLLETGRTAEGQQHIREADRLSAAGRAR